MKKTLFVLSLLLSSFMLVNCGGFSEKDSATLIEKVNSGAELTQDDYARMIELAGEAIPIIEETNRQMKSAARNGQMLDLNRNSDYAAASRAYETFTFILAGAKDKLDESNSESYTRLIGEIQAFNEESMK